MSNILIIKHGSLGDIAQISGAIQDIKENHSSDKIFCLTTPPYLKLFEKCPYIDEIIIDTRVSKLNIFYLFNLKKKLKNLNFIKVYDLQNSSRTSFYRKFIINNSNWSSTETTLPEGKKKKDFDQDSVLSRFNYQLLNSGVKTKNTTQPNFAWACDNIEFLRNKYNLNKYILLFPFCSESLSHKRWPYYNRLIDLIRKKNKNIHFVTAPGPTEISDSKNINAIPILDNEKAITIMQLAGLIKNANYVIANDTGPAHMAAHLNAKGITLFGHHTTPYKVSIETDNFKAIVTKQLKELSADFVYKKISKEISLV